MTTKKTTKTKTDAKVGRPELYDPSICRRVTDFALLGLSNEQIAGLLGVVESTFQLWITKHPELSEALKAGGEEADAKVARALYQRATGYSHVATKIHVAKDGRVVKVPYVEHYPPSEGAMTLWLSNRSRAKWKQRQEVEHQLPSGTLVIVSNGKPEEAE